MSSTDTKTALLESAQDLIQRVGVNAMSYNDLSNTVGIRKASIHYHFPKKDDLIEALLVRCGDVYVDAYRAVARSDASIPEKLEAVVGIFEDSLKKGKICTVGMLSVESVTLNEDSQKVLEATIGRCVAMIESIFIQGVADGVFPQTMNTHSAAYAFHDFLFGTQIVARSLKDTEHFRRGAAMYLDMLLP